MPKNAVRLLAGTLILAAALPGLAQIGTPPGTPYISSIFPLAPRELRQHLSRAQTAVAEERFSDAVDEIDELLDNAGSDDYFLGTPGSTDAQLSLKSQALALLGSMPLKGRKMYELKSGQEAKQALDAALAAGDLTQLTEVARRYFHTRAGYEATLLLGRCQLDQGRPLAAALTLKRIADVPVAAAQYDPELSILLATCWVHANQPASAKETLVALKQRMPQARFRLVQGEVGLFNRDDTALSWLEGIVGGSRSAFALAASEWVMYRGDEKRNAASNGGVPLLNFNWRVPTVNDPADESKVTQQLRGIRDRGEPVIAALQPLVVQDYAIVRMPDNNKLVGFNLKKQGKREWVFPPGDENPALEAARKSMAANRQQTLNLREQELRQRVFEDQAFGQVSSDGRQVYVIDELGYAAAGQNALANQVFVLGGGRRVPNNGWTKPHNLLVALDLTKQGYQNWAVGGTIGDNPALAGAFFLGAPLPAGDQLFALAEFSSEIRLLCLDPRTGGLLWKQQLAVLENLDITVDSRRRLAGASPSLAEGILVCPTSAGAAIAVDLATRTLRWGYQYGRSDITTSGSRVIRTNVSNETGRWLDATATIADGCVILTPVESTQLHCLDLLTGKAKWPAQSRDDMLYVACVHEGNIILVGQKKMKAIGLADGKSVWGPLELAGETAVGRGYYSDNHYYLPVTGQQLLKIDLNTGKIVAKAQTEVELGNLVCYKDQLISQSAQTVASFVLHSEKLQKLLDDRLRGNPQDIDALLLQAQILLQEGKSSDSLDLLRKANQIAPDKVTVRGLLAKVMLVLLRQDFAANLHLTEELDKLVTDPAQRREVLRFRVQGLARTKRTWEALTVLLELADQELLGVAPPGQPGELQAIDRELSVRSDRWLQGQIQSLIRTADSETREKLSGEIKERRDRAIQSGNAGQLRAFLNLFGSIDGSNAARLALADRLMTAEALLEAELHLGAALETADADEAGPVRAALAALYERARRPELAARLYQDLAGAFAGITCRDGLTGKQLAERAAKNAGLQAQLTHAWPLGQVEVKEADASSNLDRLSQLQRQAFPVQLVRYGGAAPRGLRATYDLNNYLVTLKGDLGQTLATSTLRNADGTARRYYASQYSLSGQAFGHLVAINFGAEVLVLDGLRADRGGDALLWRQDTLEVDPSVRQATMIYTQQRTTSNPLLGPRYVSYDPTGRMNYNNGPLRAGGFIFQRARQLICVDPLTGQTLWERSQIPPQAEVFGDDELIFVADSTGEQTLVLSAIDGTLVGKRKIDRSDRRWLTFGRNLLTYEQSGSTVKVRLYDAWRQPEADAPASATGTGELWSRSVPLGTRASPIDGESLALLEPSGQFTVVSLATGAVQFAVPLEPEPTLAWISVHSSRDQLVLLASQQQSDLAGNVMVVPLNTVNNPLGQMHGRVYAFRRSTGKLQWQVPAFVSQHGMAPDQPAESPLLFFVRNRTEAGRGNPRATTSVLVLDRRDGRPAYENDSVLPQTANNCDVLVEPLKQSVSLSLYSGTSKTLVFQLTAKPRPPQPPAQTGPLASAATGQLPGTPDNSVGQAIQRINRAALPGGILPGGIQRAVPPQPRPAPDPFAPR